MSKVKSALTRKWGPLPAWAWFLLVGGAYYLYKRYSAASSGTGTGSVGPTPATPQPQTVLQPGESVYDPNSGTLTTAPGGASGDTGGGGGTTSGDTTGASASDLAAAMDSLAGAIASGMPPSQVDVTLPTTPDSPGTAGTAHGTTKRTTKHKPKKKPTKKPVKPRGPHKGKTRPRSGASTRKNAGGRTGPRWKPSLPRPRRHSSGSKVTGRGSGGVSPMPSRARQRPRTPVVTTVQNQRPQGGFRPGRRQPAAPAPRPSAPPPRTQRSPRPARHSAPPRHRRGR